MLEYNAELRDLMNRRDELVVTFMHSVDGLLFTAHEFSLALGLKPIDTNVRRN